MERREFDWKRMAIACVLGFLGVMGVLTLRALLFHPEVECLRHYPDGSTRYFSGDDCWKPF
jgi:hypothetical protein